MNDDWRSAFFTQAQSDYEVLKWFWQKGGSLGPCHQVHYLQMVCEKLAKAFTTSGATPPPLRHEAFVRFVQREARHSRALRRACGINKQPQYRAYLDGLLPLAREIETLAPRADLQSPNPEYPWKQGDRVLPPVDYSFPRVRMANPKMVKMRKFIEACLRVGG